MFRARALDRLIVTYLIFESLSQIAGAQVAPTKPNTSTAASDQTMASLRFVAVDSEGKPANSLAAEDLSLSVGGEPRKILSVSRATNQRTFGLFFDASGSRRGDALLPWELWATARLLDSVWRPGDEGFVIDFNDEPFTVTKPTANLNQIVEGFQVVNREVNGGRGATALYDALCSVRFGPEDVDREKVFLVVSDFEDNSSHKSMKEMLQAMRKEGVQIFVLRILSKDRHTEYPERVRKSATEATEKTGGEAFIVANKDDIEEAFRRMAGAIQGSYVLTYELRARGSNGAKIELQTSRENVKLSYPE